MKNQKPSIYTLIIFLKWKRILILQKKVNTQLLRKDRRVINKFNIGANVQLNTSQFLNKKMFEKPEVSSFQDHKGEIEKLNNQISRNSKFNPNTYTNLSQQKPVSVNNPVNKVDENHEEFNHKLQNNKKEDNLDEDDLDDILDDSDTKETKKTQQAYKQPTNEVNNLKSKSNNKLTKMTDEDLYFE